MGAVYRWHPRIKASLDGPIVDRKLLHLQQSDLDGACGLHCILMALMLFGLVDRDELENVSKPQKKRLRKLWRRSRSCYFSGSHARQLQKLMAPYGKEIDCRIHKWRNPKKVLPTLADNGLGIIGISNKHLSHWVLAVGTGGTLKKHHQYRPDQLLILDPSYSPLPLLPWNGVLSLKEKRRDRYVYMTPGGREKVRVDIVLTLK